MKWTGYQERVQAYGSGLPVGSIALDPIGYVFDFDRSIGDGGLSAYQDVALGTLGVLGVNAADVSPGPAMTRATNLANLTTLALRLLPPDPQTRRRGLLSVGDGSWVAGVLSLGASVGIGLEDGVRFSLALHFLIGLLQADAGADTPFARAYLRAVALYREAEAARAGGSNGRLGDLGAEAAPGSDEVFTCGWFSSASGRRDQVRAAFRQALGREPTSAQVEFWGRTKWCGDATLIQGMKDNPNYAYPQAGPADWYGEHANMFVAAADAVGKGISAAFDWTGDILCKGFKWLLGETVGGVICAIFSTFLDFIKYTFTALIEVVRTLATGLVKVIKHLMNGEIKQAAMAFLSEVTAAVFVMPPIGPLFAVVLGVTLADIANMGRRVVERAPTFVIQLATSVMGIVSLTPAAVGNVAHALRPAVVVFAGASLAKATLGDPGLYALGSPARGSRGSTPVPKVPKEPQAPAKVVSAMESCVDSIISMCIGIVSGIVNVVQAASDMTASVTAKIGGDTAVFTDESPFSQLATNIKLLLETIVEKLSSFKFRDIIDAILNFVHEVPAVAGKTIQEGPPTPEKATAAVARLAAGKRAMAVIDLLRSFKPGDQAAIEAALQEARRQPRQP